MLFRRCSNFFALARHELDWQGKFDRRAASENSSAQRAPHGLVERIAQLGAHRQPRDVPRRKVQFRFHERMPHGHGPARAQDHFLPQPHILVRRCRIPIHKRDAQLAGVRRQNSHGHHILLARMHMPRHVELIPPKRARNFVRCRHAFTIHPDLSPVIDPAKCQPHGFPVVARRHFEFLPVPPFLREEAILRHLLIRKLRPDGIAHAGKRPQIHPKVRIGKHAVFDQRRHNRFWDGRLVPAGDVETRSRDLFSTGPRFLRRLDRPTVPQHHGFLRARGRGCEPRHEQKDAEQRGPSGRFARQPHIPSIESIHAGILRR